jgi:AcrR family transcriptional regulator
MPKSTEDLLMNGFMELISQRPLDKITVQDIADYCCVNRNTFYYHYDNVYDLVKKFFKRQTDSALEYMRNGESLKNCLKAIVMFALDHMQAAKNLANSLNRDLLSDYLGDSFTRLIKTYIDENYEIHDEDKLRERLIVGFYRYAFVGMMMDLMTRDFSSEQIPDDELLEKNASPEFIVDLVLDTIEHDITANVMASLEKKEKIKKL